PKCKHCMYGASLFYGRILLAGGAAGKRYVLPNSRVMIHQPLGVSRVKLLISKSMLRKSLTIKQKLNNLLAEHTGQPLEVIERDT
ncbi:ATP-dependent Clp protease proteolytic subunit, partial [Vibrio parahaemolyticus]|nr:ATP-dependent Clp protease proteolytic subunit [Vibrio parahaemolyticus]